MSLSDLHRQKILYCLNKLYLKSGFDSFEKFRKYNENKMCFTGYKPVFPDIQVISTTDDKTYDKTETDNTK